MMRPPLTSATLDLPNKRLNRRAFMRAGIGGLAGATVAAPLLGSLGARAQAETFPTRLLVFFTPNGTNPGVWFPTAGASEKEDAFAYRADVVVAFSDWLESVQGDLSLYGQRLEAGYSGAGLNTATDTDQYGGELRMPVTDDLRFVAKADRTVQDRGLENTVAEVNVAYEVTDGWRLEMGARHDDRKDDAPTPPR